MKKKKRRKPFCNFLFCFLSSFFFCWPKLIKICCQPREIGQKKPQVEVWGAGQDLLPLPRPCSLDPALAELRWAAAGCSLWGCTPERQSEGTQVKHSDSGLASFFGPSPKSVFDLNLYFHEICRQLKSKPLPPLDILYPLVVLPSVSLILGQRLFAAWPNKWSGGRVTEACYKEKITVTVTQPCGTAATLLKAALNALFSA